MRISASGLAEKKVLICGVQGSGKTHLARFLVRRFSPYTAMVYTPFPDEWEAENVVLARPRDFVAEMPAWVMAFKASRKLKVLVIDEADLLFRHHFDTNEQIRDLVIGHRHYGKTLIFVTRRPQDIPARLYGTFEYLAIFTIDSPQVIDLLNRWVEGLGDLVRSLPYGSHQFIWRKIGEAPRVAVVGG